MDHLVFIRNTESDPPRYVETVDADDGTKAIEAAGIGEGEYLAFSLESATTRRVRLDFSLEEIEAPKEEEPEE